MDNALMIGLSRQLTLRRAMDVTANNIANANTPGFKVESLLLQNQPARRAESQDGPRDLQFVENWGVARDFGQGRLEYTGRPLDLAFEGEGFFAVETEGGDLRYTRDGRFRLDQEGRLAATDGSLVLDEGGAPILLEPGGGHITVQGGAILQDGNEVARLGAYTFENLGALEKTGDGRYRAPEGVDADLAEEININQGYVESSNVQQVLELTRMMETMRAYQSVSRFIQQGEELDRKAIERLGRV
ncbi:flagellar hook-basal body complex protein [Hyphobacterium marinum]|uniref:Flagellar hook-basal body complex protein n=1 Tax=Hyphobacterium marinum TaxID=3116574 RepID=A0ABU7LZS4_9PROT|nr:flagellar hook-basal body complex protein [Hyphobacterium sp. Y6023]MEE2567053.1 flagellar hook-basal body complex protein [Hyphobacterium sp. Y6023]